MQRSLSDYYHNNIRDYLRFVIPPGQNILFFEPYCVGDLKALQPARGITVHPFESGGCQCGFKTHIGLNLKEIEGTFDYIVLCNILGFCDDIGSFFRGLTRLCTPDTRVMILKHSYYWTPVLRLAEFLGLKRPGGLANLLSFRDILSYMTASGFQFIDRTTSLMCPLFLMGLGPVINLIARCLPIFDWAKLNQFNIFRLTPSVPANHDASVTVCLTCRDEKENIEPLVESIPSLSEKQEILFVEGHSVDGTRQEIERVRKKYPAKNIRVIDQPGKGQGDAIREGFANAKGDIIILLEADMTSPPENISYIYESMKLNQAEFLEGSRFVYHPLSHGAIPFIRQIGNWVFALVFSWLFHQHMTDVLSGIKAIHKRNFDRILMRWGQWGIEDPFADFELLFGAMRLGLKGAELPINYMPRAYGQSKTKVLFHGWILFKMAVVAFSHFRR